MVRQSPAPDAASVQRARDVYQRVRAVQDARGARRLAFTWQELGDVATLAGRAAGIPRVGFARGAGRGWLAASLPLPGGFWLNGQLFVAAGDDGRLSLSGRAGRLPLPGFVVHGAIALGRVVLRLRGAEMPPLHSLVRAVDIGETGIVALLDLPSRSRLVTALGGLREGAIDAARTADHYCRLRARESAEASDTDFASLVRAAFTGGDGSAEDNRAIFVALSLLAAQIDGGTLGEGRQAIVDRCGVSSTAYLLLGRNDLVKHWSVSGALTAAFGQDASLSVGTWKEISDSGSGGSGFSLVDLAADRSGTFCAQRGAAAGTARALRDWLAAAQETDLLPLGALANAEGMSEDEFRARFTDTDSRAYQAAVQRIDASLAVLIRF
jgi:uncharacterized protein YfiM (DUF2279 family)